MSYIHPAWVEHQRQRWLRPDWQHWMRHDAHRFALPEAEAKSYAARLVERRRIEEKQAIAAERDALGDDLQRLRWLVRNLKIDLAIRRLRRKYSPDQPRDELGRWTDAGANTNTPNDSEVTSDETPDNEAIPRAQYAANRPRGSTSVRIGGRTFEIEGGQAARLEEAQARAETAIARVRELDASWKPTPSFYESVEGRIRAYNSEAREAQARGSELGQMGIGPGPFAGESFPARGLGRNFTAEERNEINRIGSETGCHTCGTSQPGTPLGNFVADHQPPSVLNSLGRAQRLYPQCLSCSVHQGGWAHSLSRKK